MGKKGIKRARKDPKFGSRFASLTSSVHRAHERVRARLSSLLRAKIATVKEMGKRQADKREESW